MKAMVYHGPGSVRYQEADKPKIEQATDAVVKILKTTICGTDLHILKGDTPEVPAGLTLGHEGVGIVEEVGSSVKNIKKGDKVLISCITSCGGCRYCKRSLPAHCEDGGWLLGHLINGTQAEYVRTPHADNSLFVLPPSVDEEAAVMLSDILPTGLEIGVLNGKVQPGQIIAIVGAGPVGMAALLTAQFYSPAVIIMIDNDDERLAMATQFGATHTINPSRENVQKAIFALTNNDGVDVAIECVGIPATFQACQDIVAKGGIIANVGVHGKPVDLHLEQLWIKNISITTGLVNTTSTPMLLNVLKSQKIQPQKLVTHRFSMNQFEQAYKVFSNAAAEKAMKVIISAD
ncbi:zinc-dependent alcohol dehydrogenase family protein [Stenoxybacter acetivorans]|uniref:zinc-dependent alcohol dehydrogenase family protein n=1 Tax=Stenoxybacter acetivorans TaxID=422441 RepID=UPI0005647C21|nr:zinc-dependent alcohol dehydrogenase family protein [Stenoxybacter acetivorans]